MEQTLTAEEWLKQQEMAPHARVMGIYGTHMKFVNLPELLESYAQQIREEDKLPINFWTRLKDFIEDVQVNDPASEEEKGMIVHVCNEFTKKQ